MDKKKQKKEQLDDAIENATKRAKFEELQLELARVKADHEEIRNQLKRAVADYHNLEKRVQEGRSELTKWGTGELLVKLLPALDHLEQALVGTSESDRQSGWFRGVELAVKELNQVLQSEGLEQIASDGQFDPNLHEAVDTTEGEENKVLKVVRKGYKLNDRVLRPAQVIVGKKNPPSMEETKDIPGGETESDFHIPPEEEGEK